MMARSCMSMLVFFALLATATATHADPLALSPRMQRLCSKIEHRKFIPAESSVRLPEDPILAAISRTDNAVKIKALLRFSDLDAPRSKNGTTALVYTVSVPNWPAALVLINSGANINQPTSNGESPLERAIGLLHGDVACQLIAHGAALPVPSANTANLLPISSLLPAPEDALALAEFLLEKGYPVDAQLLPLNQTALHIAAERGNIELARLLLQKGANPALTTSQGESALAIARRVGQPGIVRLLNKAGIAK